MTLISFIFRTDKNETPVLGNKSWLFTPVRGREFEKKSNLSGGNPISKIPRGPSEINVWRIRAEMCVKHEWRRANMFPYIFSADWSYASVDILPSIEMTLIYWIKPICPILL